MDPMLEKLLIGGIVGGTIGLALAFGPALWRALTERPKFEDDAANDAAKETGSGESQDR